MPKLTISAGLTAPIPSTQRFNVPATRKGLVFTLISGDAFWGWTSTVTAAGNTDAGIPMTVGAPVMFHSETFDFSAAVNIFTAAGCVINYRNSSNERKARSADILSAPSTFASLNPRVLNPSRLLRRAWVDGADRMSALLSPP